MARKTKAEATRQTILTAALEVFASRGVAQASLEEIAREAGVTRGAVYWHFKNKGDVFWALYEQMYLPFYEMVLNDLTQDHPSPLQQLEDCVPPYLQTLQRMNTNSV
ncbi:MAG: TetR family transcriptional regulator [Pseudomonadales bacterium]|nr:TetR family transcriptional regulator [Pseudomonadales bacterium]